MRYSVISSGFRLGRYFVPSFRIERGEVAELVVPFCAGSAEDSQLLRALTGQSTFGGLDVKMPYLEAPLTMVLRIQKRWRRKVLRDIVWPNDITFRELQTLGFLPYNGDEILGRLKWTQGVILSMALALVQCDSVIFSTSGCDPNGVREVGAWLSTRMDRTHTVLHVFYPPEDPHMHIPNASPVVVIQSENDRSLC